MANIFEEKKASIFEEEKKSIFEEEKKSIFEESDYYDEDDDWMEDDEDEYDCEDCDCDGDCCKSDSIFEKPSIFESEKPYSDTDCWDSKDAIWSPTMLEDVMDKITKAVSEMPGIKAGGLVIPISTSENTGIFDDEESISAEEAKQIAKDVGKLIHLIDLFESNN